MDTPGILVLYCINFSESISSPPPSPSFFSFCWQPFLQSLLQGPGFRMPLQVIDAENSLASASTTSSTYANHSRSYGSPDTQSPLQPLHGSELAQQGFYFESSDADESDLYASPGTCQQLSEPVHGVDGGSQGAVQRGGRAWTAGGGRPHILCAVCLLAPGHPRRGHIYLSPSGCQS